MSRARTLPHGLRLANYEAQNAGRPLTPAQRRRLRAKENALVFGTAGKGRLKRRFFRQEKRKVRTSVASMMSLFGQLRRAGGIQHLAAQRAVAAQLAERQAEAEALRAAEAATEEGQDEK